MANLQAFSVLNAQKPSTSVIKKEADALILSLHGWYDIHSRTRPALPSCERPVFRNCVPPDLDVQRRVASLSIAEVYSIAMLDILILSLIV